MPIPTVRVVAAIIFDGPQLLVCQRPAHKRHGGLWEFPGGKCELGESDADTAARELSEELGVTVTGISDPLFSSRDPGSEFEIVFVPTTVVGAPRCTEHSALCWGTLLELSALPLAPSDKRFVEFLLGTP
jgi:mutator protein MutT